MDIGQLWVDLGVNLAGLNTAYAAFGKLEGVAKASLGKITEVNAASATAMSVADERLLIGRIARFDRYEAKALKTANDIVNAQIALDIKLELQQIKSVNARVAAEAKAAAKIIADAEKAAIAQEALFNRVAVAEAAYRARIAATSAAQITASERAFAAMAGNINKMSLAFTRFGQSMTMYVTAPILLIGAGVVKAVTQLDTLEKKIVALTSTTQEQMNAWRSDIRRMSDETNRSASEITESFYFVANSALSAATTLKIVDLATKASAIGMGTASDVGKALTFIYNAYGESAFDAAKSMDILTVAIREGVIEINQIVPVIGPVLPFAAKLGVSFDQVASSIAIMTRTGFNAARAATSVRAMLQGIADPAPGAQKALKAMGSSFEELRAIIRDQGLVAALVKIDGIIEKFGETASGQIFKNIRAEMGALGQMGPQLLASIEVAKKAKEEAGSFSRAWEIAKTSVQFSLDGVKVAFQNIFLSIGGQGGGLIRFFNELKDSLNGVANWFKNLTPAMQQHYIHMALWAAAIGPIVLFTGNLIRVLGGLYTAVVWVTTPWPKLILFITNFKRVLIFNATAISAQWMSMLGVIGITNPWIGAAIAIGIVTAALITYFAMQEKVTEAQKAVNEVNTTAATSAIREKVQIEQLLRVAQSEYTSKEQKLDAIKQINAISPEHLGNITLEKVKTEETTGAVNKYIDALQRKAKAQAIQEKMVEVEKTHISDIISGEDKRVSNWKKMMLIVAASRTGVENYYDYINKAEKENAKESNRNFQETIDKLQAMADALTGVTKARDALNGVPLMMQGVKDYSIGETEAQKKARLNAALLAGDKGKSPLQEAIDNLRKGEKYIAFMSSQTGLLGESFNKTSESTSLFSGSLKTFFELVGANDPTVKRLIADINNLMSPEVLMADAMIEMNKQLEHQNALTSVTGNSLEGMNSRLSILTETYKKLASIKGNKGSSALTTLKKDIDTLTEGISMKTLQKSLADAAMGSSFLGGSFDELGTKINAHKARIADLKKAWDAATEAGRADLMMDALLGAQTEQSAISVLELNNITKKYNDSLKDLNNIQGLTGISFGMLDERIKIEQTHIEDLTVKQRDLVKDTEAWLAIQKELNVALANLSTIQAVKSIEDYNKAIANARDKKGGGGLGLGSDISSWVRQKEIAEKALEAAIKERSGKTSGSYAEALINDNIATYQADINKASKNIKFQKIMGGISEGLSQLQPLMSNYVSLLDAQQNRALAMIQRVAIERHKSEAWVAKENAKVNEQYSKKKKQMALAEAVVNTAVSVTKTMAEMGWWGLVLVPLILAAGAMQIAAINAQPMAEGGIVPGGYRNDTYPALLTSGETVVPPGKLNSIMGGSERKFKPVIFKIGINELTGILEEAETLNHSY